MARYFVYGRGSRGFEQMIPVDSLDIARQYAEKAVREQYHYSNDAEASYPEVWIVEMVETVRAVPPDTSEPVIEHRPPVI